MSPLDKIAATAPDHIWLDLGEEAHLVEEGTTFKDLGGVTWSEDNATGQGIKYVRALASHTGEAEPVGWQVRGIGREDGPGQWRHAESEDMEAYRNGPDCWELRPVYATPLAATPAAPGERAFIPNLWPVIESLEGGCDPQEAARELRGYAARIKTEKTAALSHPAPAVECRDCCGTGIDGDCGPDGRTIDIECGACKGTGRTRDAWQVATERLERVFQKSVVGMVPAEYATGYTEALSHVRRALSNPAPVAAPAPASEAVAVEALMYCMIENGFLPSNRDYDADMARAKIVAEWIAKQTTSSPKQQAGEAAYRLDRLERAIAKAIPLGSAWHSSVSIAMHDFRAALKGEQPVEPSGGERGEV